MHFYPPSFRWRCRKHYNLSVYKSHWHNWRIQVGYCLLYWKLGSCKWRGDSLRGVKRPRNYDVKNESANLFHMYLFYSLKRFRPNERHNWFSLYPVIMFRGFSFLSDEEVLRIKRMPYDLKIADDQLAYFELFQIGCESARWCQIWGIVDTNSNLMPVTNCSLLLT